MKAVKTILAFVLIILPLVTFAQTKDLRETQTQISYDLSPNGPFGGQVDNKSNEPAIQELVKRIDQARTNGDVNTANELNQQLENLSGNKSIKSNGYSGPQVIGKAVNEPVDPSKYNITILNNGGFWAHATSTDRVTGRVWAAGSKYNSTSGQSDTLLILTSTDDGVHWTTVFRIGYTVGGVVFRPDDLDIEAVNNGTSSYLFGTGALTYLDNVYSFMFRINANGGEFQYIYLYSSSTNNRYYHARLTSDNSRYTAATFIYSILTHDSILTSGTSKVLRSKFSIITNPFAATFTVTERNNNNGGFFWFSSPGYISTNDTSTLYSDIGFVDSLGAAKLVVASNFYRCGVAASYNLYMASSNNFGVTIPNWTYQITETKPNYQPKVVSCGLDTPSVGIAYTRYFSATDIDPYFQKSTNSGVTWIGSYISGTTDSTLYTDAIAIPRKPNAYNFTYSVKNSSSSGGDLFIKSYRNTTYSTAFQLNTTAGSITFTPVRAGYRYSSDSCFATGSNSGGSSFIAYTGCSGTATGIGNNQLPVDFKLEQNYPNPFNPVTKISYAIPVQGLVTLKVYDVLGKEVATLVNETKTAGNYSIDFNASSFASGIYFYKIETKGFSDIKKMMLIK